MTNQELIALAGRVLVQNYRQQPLALTRGEGCRLWDADGRTYLDMTAGIAVAALGHAHPKLTRAIAEQAGRLMTSSNLFHAEETIRCADVLTQRSFASRVFFCNSGAEANEAAIKLARRYAQKVLNTPERTLLVATEGSFHGRTIATMSLTGQEKYRTGFGPLLEPVRFVPYGDAAALAAILDEGRACAFILEPIQAEGGLIVAPPGYLAKVRELCTKTGTLLLFDEVQTGFGRTGTLFGYEHDGVTPDVMSLAKGLAGGVPMGAILATEEAAKGLIPAAGEAVPHASTFGGNPLACRAARAVLEIFEEDQILEHVRTVGDHLGRRLEALAQEHPGIALEARGRGLLRGLAVRSRSPASGGADVATFVAKAREKGVLFSIAGAQTIRFAPPLIVTTAELDEACNVLGEVLRAS